VGGLFETGGARFCIISILEAAYTRKPKFHFHLYCLLSQHFTTQGHQQVILHERGSANELINNS
jgi:hypothetical protein